IPMTMKNGLLALLLAFAALLAPRAARADEPSYGRLELRGADGARMLELGSGAEQNKLRGTFTIKNVGESPVHIARVVTRHSKNDPRLPPGVTVKLTQAGATLEH